LKISAFVNIAIQCFEMFVGQMSPMVSRLAGIEWESTVLANLRLLFTEPADKFLCDLWITERWLPTKAKCLNSQSC